MLLALERTARVHRLYVRRTFHGSNTAGGSAAPAAVCAAPGGSWRPALQYAPAGDFRLAACRRDRAVRAAAPDARARRDAAADDHARRYGRARNRGASADDGGAR